MYMVLMPFQEEQLQVMVFPKCSNEPLVPIFLILKAGQMMWQSVSDWA
jgi:hypothetical protein